MKATTELEASHQELMEAEEVLLSGPGGVGSGARVSLTPELERYLRANRRYLENVHRCHSSGVAGKDGRPHPELAVLGRHVRDLWSDKQRVVAATANFIGKNKEFQQVHNALLKHIDQSWRCFQSLYVLLGGDIADLHRK